MRDAQGSITTFDAPGAGSGIFGIFAGTYPRSINSKGDVAGYYIDSRYHGFIRDQHGNFTTVDVPGAFATAIGSINSQGAIAGYYFDYNSTRHGFVRDKRGNLNTFDAQGADFTDQVSQRIGVES